MKSPPQPPPSFQMSEGVRRINLSSRSRISSTRNHKANGPSTGCARSQVLFHEEDQRQKRTVWGQRHTWNPQGSDVQGKAQCAQSTVRTKVLCDHAAVMKPAAKEACRLQAREARSLDARRQRRASGGGRGGEDEAGRRSRTRPCQQSIAVVTPGIQAWRPEARRDRPKLPACLDHNRPTAHPRRTCCAARRPPPTPASTPAHDAYEPHDILPSPDTSAPLLRCHLLLLHRPHEQHAGPP